MEKNNFVIHLTAKYKKEFKRLTKKNRELAFRIVSVLKKLRKDPSNPGLRTHIVYSSYGARTYTSRVSGDIRILWRFEDGNIILLLTIGGHSGSRKVYK